MNETANKQEEVKGEKVKRRTSLKNIIGGDILATDFFRRQTKLLVNRVSKNISRRKKAICRLRPIRRT